MQPHQPLLSMRLVCLALTTSVLFSIDVHATNAPPQSTINICYYTDFRPIAFGTSKKFEGYEGDLLRAIAKLWHKQEQLRFHPTTTFGLYLRAKTANATSQLAASRLP
jgi:hypothetical protein